MDIIKLLLVEDNTIVREGIAGLIEIQEDLEVIGEAAGGPEALSLLQGGLRPDIVLTDLNMPVMDGIELTERICALEISNISVIMLTMHNKQIFVDKSFKAGAKGFLLKNGDFEELFMGIRQVYQNEFFVSAGIQN